MGAQRTQYGPQIGVATQCIDTDRAMLCLLFDSIEAHPWWLCSDRPLSIG